MLKKYRLTVACFSVLSIVSFFAPILMEFISNKSIFRMQIFIPMSVLIINIVPFIAISEIIKIYYGFAEDAPLCKRAYNFFIKKPNSVIIVSIFDGIGTFLLTVMYYVLWGGFRLRSIICHNILIFLTYLCGNLVFYYVKNRDLGYRKRDYIFYRPFLLLGVPVGIAISLIDVLNGEMIIYANIPIVLAVMVFAFSYITYKRYFKSYVTYTAVLSGLLALSVIMYYIFGTNEETILRKSHSIIVFSVAFGIYLNLLFSLIYTDIFPIRTNEYKHSIEKLQYALFNFSPVISLCFLVEAVCDWKIIFSYAVLNISAILCIGRKNTIHHKIAVVGLILIYIPLSMYTLYHETNYEMKIDTQLTILSFISSILVVVLPNVFKTDSHIIRDVQKHIQGYKFLRKNLAYYTTTALGCISLLVIAYPIMIIHQGKELYLRNSAFFYIVAVTIIAFVRGIFDYRTYKE